jgi:gamma-glutamylputrescine oxidase
MSWLHANGEDGRYPDTVWAEGARGLGPLAPLDGDARADLCVVGGGITGLSAALHAAQAGMDVILLEGQRVAWGASGRNGGQVGSGLNWGQRRLEARLGPEAARALWALTEEAKRLTRALIERHAPEAGYRGGVIQAALSGAEAAAYARDAEHLARAYGAAPEVLDAAEIARRTGSRAFAGGVLDRSAGFCNPLAYAFGLARACLAAGVRIHERTEATGVTPCHVTTKLGAVRAGAVVLAVNGYGGHLHRGLGARVLPINNYIAATEPLGTRAPMPRPVAVADSRFVVNYFWQDGAGRLIYGGGESYGRRYPRDIAGRVRRNLARVYPQLADVAFTHAWGGTLAVTATRLPLVTELEPKLWAAGGYSGHGLALSGLVGQVLAEAARGDRRRLRVLGQLPVPALPGGRWLGGAMTTAGMAWMAARDRFRPETG